MGKIDLCFPRDWRDLKKETYLLIKRLIHLYLYAFNVSELSLWARVHRFPVCRMSGLKRYPDGSASTAWNYNELLCKLYQDVGSKRCHHYEIFRAQSSLHPFPYTDGATFY